MLFSLAENMPPVRRPAGIFIADAGFGYLPDFAGRRVKNMEMKLPAAKTAVDNITVGAPVRINIL